MGEERPKLTIDLGAVVLEDLALVVALLQGTGGGADENNSDEHREEGTTDFRGVEAVNLEDDGVCDR